jgi:biopolymer transport protein ExbB
MRKRWRFTMVGVSVDPQKAAPSWPGPFVGRLVSRLVRRSTGRSRGHLALMALLTLGPGALQPLPAAAQSRTTAAGAPEQSLAPPGQTAEQADTQRLQWWADLTESVRALRADEEGLSQRREEAARAKLEEQERQTREAIDRRDAAEQRSMVLDVEWQRNEERSGELSMLLRQHAGNLGELFGVTRQVASDAANVLEQSLLTAQYAAHGDREERSEFLRRIAGATALPSITELERLWFELHREMTAAAAVERFAAPVVPVDAGAAPTMSDVVRVGPFTVVGEGEYLGYLPSRKALTRLESQLDRKSREIGRQLESAPPDGGYVSAVVDPARGALLGLHVARPNFIERIQHGKAVGYVIIAVGLLGALSGLYQWIYLIVTGRAVGAQLRRLDDPKPDNPLGRLLLTHRRNDRHSENLALARLRVSEAVLREVPRLERVQPFLRIAVAAGPLLGLIGTVIGMIITFKVITASGSSDPKLMAQGIGQAMIATVLGLGIAIPLLFLNAALAARSHAITQILDEQSRALLAERPSTERFWDADFGMALDSTRPPPAGAS